MPADSRDMVLVPDPMSHATGWAVKWLDGAWRIGMRGNLDVWHDAVVTVHTHTTNDEAKKVADWIAAAYNAALSAPPARGEGDAGHDGIFSPFNACCYRETCRAMARAHPTPATPAGEELREKVVWIVHGTSGEWSDRTEWCIEAHTDETRAKDRVAELTALARELAAAYPEVSEEAWESENYEEHPSYIANREWQRRCDEAGVGSDPEETRFFVSKVPLAALQPQAEGE